MAKSHLHSFCSRMPDGADVVPVTASALSVSMIQDSSFLTTPASSLESSSVPPMQQLRAPDPRLPANGIGRGQLVMTYPRPMEQEQFEEDRPRKAAPKRTTRAAGYGRVLPH